MTPLFKNPMFNIRLRQSEYTNFCTMLPLTSLGATEVEKSKALSVVGLDNPIIFEILAHHDPDVVNAFHVVLLALQLTQNPRELSTFLSRVDFINDGFRKRLFRELKCGLWMFEDADTLSTKQLNDMWKLESRFNDGGNPIL